MSTRQQYQHWNAEATEIQMNPGGPDQKKTKHQAPTNLMEVFLGRSYRLVCGMQLKRAANSEAAKLLTVIELTTKHAVCRITGSFIEWL